MGYFTMTTRSSQDEIVANGKYLEAGEKIENSNKVKTTSLDDYFYQPGSEQVLQVHTGSAQKNLFMPDNISNGDYSNLCKGVNPITGEIFLSEKRIKQLESTAIDDKKTVIAFSTSYNVDKSISLLYSVSDNETKKQIEFALITATKKAIKYAENNIVSSRFRGNNNELEAVSGKMICLSYLHFTNRAREPHLHIHCEIPNSLLCDDGQWRTIDGKTLYKNQHELAAIFDSALAVELIKIPNETIRNTIGNNFSGRGLVFDYISDKMISKASSRSNEIKKASVDAGVDSAAFRKSVAMKSRKGKEEIDFGDLLSEWKNTYNEDLTKDLKSYLSIDDDKKINRLTPSLLSIERAIFNGGAICSKKDLNRVALQISINNGGLDKVNEITDAIYNQMQFIPFVIKRNNKLETVYSTNDLRLAELDVISASHRLNRKQFGGVDTQIVDTIIKTIQNNSDQKAKKLTEEQADSVRFITQPGLIKLVQGAAGVGKSFSLATVKNIYEQAGYTVSGMAPSGAAAASLSSDIKAEAHTSHRVMLDIEKGKKVLTNKDVLIIDESGMLDLRLFAKIMQSAEKADSKIILTGDYKQKESVGTVSIYRTLIEEIGCSRIEKIMRQQEDKKALEIAQCLCDQNFLTNTQAANPVELLKNNNQLIYSERPIEHILSKLGENTDFTKSGVLILADTNASVRYINNAIRDKLKQAGKLSEEKTFTAKYGNVSEHDIAVAIGDRIMLRKNSSNFSASVIEEFESVANKVNVGRFKTGSGKKTICVYNGDNGSVVGFTDKDEIRYRLDRTGETITIPADFTGITHSYAMTVHKSQGLTNQNAIYLNENGGLSSIYVAYTRGKTGATIVVPHDPKMDVDGVGNFNKNIVAADIKQTVFELLPDFVKEQARNTTKANYLSHDYNVLDLITLNSERLDLSQINKQQKISNNLNIKTHTDKDKALCDFFEKYSVITTKKEITPKNKKNISERIINIKDKAKALLIATTQKIKSLQREKMFESVRKANEQAIIQQKQKRLHF